MVELVGGGSCGGAGGVVADIVVQAMVAAAVVAPATVTRWHRLVVSSGRYTNKDAVICLR